MSTPGMPPWGCPWHGLVKDGQLALPNGQSLAYPQPGGDQWQSGSTALLKHPAAAPITRTPEEQAADDATGRQWWSAAILAHSQLHGVNLNGWIYIDPAGERWLVQTTLHNASVAGGSATFTLKRFGVLGGAAIKHSYSVAVPDMGQSTPAISGSNGGVRVSRYHTRPDGSAAVFEVSAGFSTVDAQFWPWRPVGWLEVTLTGPGSECEIAVAVLKTREQTLGSASAEAAGVTADNYYLRENADLTTDVVQTPPGSEGWDGNWWPLVTHSIISGVETSGVLGYVVGMHYDAAGERHEVTLNELAVTHYESPALIHAGPVTFAVGVPVTGSWTCTTAWDSTLTLTYLLDGVQLCSYALSVVEHSTQVYTRNGSNPATRSADARADFTPGAYLEVSVVTERPISWSQGEGLGGTFAETLYATAETADVPIGLGGGGLIYGWYYEPNHLRYLRSCPYRYSSQLFGQALWQQPQQADDTLVRTVYRPDVATPVGVATFPELVLEKNSATSTFTNFAYGSWCPVTGQSVRDIEPVCYV